MSTTTYANRYATGFGFGHRRTATSRVGSAERVRAVARPFVSYYWKQRTIRELSRLEDYRLEDIGITRSDIPKVADDLARAEASAWVRHATGTRGLGG